MGRLKSWLGQPVSGASLAVLRASFGAVMVYQAYEFIEPLGQKTAYGKVTTLVRHIQEALSGHSDEPTILTQLYTGPHVNWNFGFPGLEWIRPLPEPWMTGVILVLVAASVLLTVGYLSRFAAVVVGVIYTYLWMIETTWWNNHFYLSSLFCLLLALTPCNRCLAVDRWLVTRRRGSGGQWDACIPFWPVFLFRAQMFLVYTYAAFVKMNPDWMSGEPMRTSLRNRTIAKPLEEMVSPETMDRVYGVIATEPVVYLLAYGGLVFDLSIGVMLCLRRTQLLGLVLVLLFHGSNYFIFNIGAFPVMGVAATLIFFDADWPIRVWRWLRQPSVSPPDPGWMLAGMLAVPIIGAVLGWRTRPSATSETAKSFPVSNVVVSLLAAYLVLQTLLPLRHLLIDSDVHWTGEGSKFAWQMMARSHTGHIRYRIQDPAWVKEEEPYPPVDWPEIEGSPSKPLYRDVDIDNLSEYPFGEVVVVLEPFLGERLFFNPAVRGLKTPEACRERADEIWESAYGRKPALHPTRPLADIIGELVSRGFASQSDPDGKMRKEFQTIGLALIRQDRQLREGGSESVVRLEDRLAAESQLGRFFALAGKLGVRDALLEIYRCRAFDVFGGPGSDWYVVWDPPVLAQGGALLSTRIRWNQFAWEPIVWTDFTYIPGDMMHFLPKHIFGYDKQGEPVVLWNVERDLVPFPPMRGHVAWGFMIHQYANKRIAKDWQEKTGVWPRVYAESYSKLNQHPMQPLVDPTVDLASVPLRMWSHNPWILPMRARNVVYHENGEPRYRLEETPSMR